MKYTYNTSVLISHEKETLGGTMEIIKIILTALLSVVLVLGKQYALAFFLIFFDF